MIVKVCGITRREDAEAAARFGASAIGFIFYKPSPRYVAPEKARELGEGLTLWKVGVFVDESPEAVVSTIADAKLDVAQIYGAFRINTRTTRFWQAIRIPAMGGFGFGTGSCEALFCDSAANGVSFNWEIARRFGEHHRVIIAGGLDASNVGEAIRIAQPWGVDASSKLEISPGVKDHEKMRRFILAAKSCDSNGAAREIS